MVGPAQAMLEVSGLHKRYGAVRALDGLGFQLRAGEVLGLLGPNGAGKTTAVECIAGLTLPDEGAILLDGQPLGRKERGRIGLALQDTALQDKVTPHEALALFARLYSTEIDIFAILDRFGLSEQADSHYAKLSGGQKQRVALAIALVNDPSLLLLDEPTAGLDPAARAGLHHLIRELADDGHAVLLATHDMAEAEQLCDRILIIDHGQAVAEGSPADLVDGGAIGTVIEGRATLPLDPSLLPPVAGLEISGSEFRCRTTEPNRTAVEILAALETHGAEIASLRIGKATLEDVILSLTAGRDAE